MSQISAADLVFIILPIVFSMIVACLVTFRLLRKEFYWLVIPFAIIAAIALLLTG